MEMPTTLFDGQNGISRNPWREVERLEEEI